MPTDDLEMVSVVQCQQDMISGLGSVIDGMTALVVLVIVVCLFAQWLDTRS